MNQVVAAAGLIKLGCELYKTDPVETALKEQKNEAKEDAEILGMMRTQPERIRSFSPKSCEKYRAIADRVIHKTELTAPSEVTLMYYKLYNETIAQCGGKCRNESSV